MSDEPMADMCRYWIESYITWRGLELEGDRDAASNAEKCKARAIKVCGGAKKAKARYLEILKKQKMYREVVVNDEDD